MKVFKSYITYLGIWKKLSYAFLICTCFYANAEENEVLIPKKPDWSATLIKELRILENPEAKITIHDLVKNPGGYIFSENTFGHADLKKNYWARCIIKNENNREEWISFESKYWDFVTVYIIDSSKVTQILDFGILKTHSTTQAVLSPNHTYTLFISFGSQSLFRRESNINLILSKTVSRLEKQGLWNYLDGIILGIMFGLAMYNLFLFISIREQIYFWYSVYTLSIVVMFMSFYSSAPSHLQEYFFTNNASFPFYLRKITETITWIIYGQFARIYLDTKHKIPFWDKAIQICMFITVIGFFLALTSAMETYIYFHFMVAFTSIIAGALRYFDGFKIARFFLVAQIFVVLGLFIVSGQYLKLDFLYFLPHNQVSNYFRSSATLYACGAIEAILFSFALGGKYNALQQDIARVRLEKELEKQALLQSQNETLEQQVNQRTLELTHSLESLKTTQAQLIQSEKMASLGELTAGIAHEIQNPLNFITNFSSLNIELLNESTGENNQEEPRNESPEQLIEIVKNNSQKINFHGKRIDSIVKSMLEHSRSSTGKIEETDINQLCEESLKLAFHGFRAKEKAFNALYETKFDKDLPKLKIVKQDFSRALLNIINNAFYAVDKKNKKLKESLTSKDGKPGIHPAFQPKVTIFTRSLPGRLEINVIDNGSGVPLSVQDKIFQPFFTTKPTGEGTGLGLSLAYDIITNSLKGKLSMTSMEDEYTEFIISLPA